MNKKDWFKYFAPRFAALAAIMGFILRIILIFMPQTVRDFGFADILRIFGLGLLNDVAFSAIALVPAFVVYSLMTSAKYRRPAGYIIEGLLAALSVYVIGFNDITDEYGGVVPGIANALVAIIFVCFSIKLFVPAVRDGWRRFSAVALSLLYIICAVLIFVCEIVFWEEFAVRFNFIAVDYLVYTNEVIGNIMESYNIPLMSLGVLGVSLAVSMLLFRRAPWKEFGIGSAKEYVLNLCGLIVCAGAGFGFLHWGYRNLGTSDMFVTQLQESGCWDFLEAFASNELDYASFYPMLPEKEAIGIRNELCGTDDSGVRHVEAAGTPQKKNIVLITIESMSASYLSRYGNTRGITPNLDTLIDGSLSFDRLFATGNRTVRGLEAVTACIPPSSGESLVKRPGVGKVFSTGEVLRNLGYSTSYVYGGDAYFDNMEAFFSANGYRIRDKKTFGKSDITFDNIWGTCDEDTYRVVLRDFDAGQEPFFAHIMTVSNHRPYTYPDGRIEYDGNPMSRYAAVKYTDYAIGQFMREASGRPWFKNTVFVIMADHCASSAGKTSLPLNGYHIPAFIYAPGFIEARRIGKVCSQIDVMPTLFSLLGFSYDSKFYGQDVLADDFRERAFMATYQDLGYYDGEILTVLSPVRRVRQFRVSEGEGYDYSETFMEDVVDEKGMRAAQALYQTVNMEYSVR